MYVMEVGVALSDWLLQQELTVWRPQHMAWVMTLYIWTLHLYELDSVIFDFEYALMATFH